MTRSIRRAASACLALTSLFSLAAQAAEAGQYTVVSCRDPFGAPMPISDASGGWRHESGPGASTGLSFSDTCTSGGTLAVGVGGADRMGAPYVYSQATFRPPANTTITGFALGWDGYAIPAAASKAGFVNVDSSERRHASFVASGGIGAQWTSAHGLDASYVTLHAGCQGGDVACGGGAPGVDARADLTRSEITLKDDHSPKAAVWGPGTERSTWTGRQSITVDAEDVGSGVFAAAVHIDGKEHSRRAVDANGGRCVAMHGGRIFAYPRPCALDPAALEIALMAQALMDGPHTVEVVVDDAGGNVRTTWLGTKVFDSHPPVLDGQTTIAGTGREGEALTCVAPTIDGQEPDVTYSWARAYADGSNRTILAGATTDTYTPTPEDVGRKLLCTVTAADAGGSASRESALTSGPFAEGGTVRGVCDGLPTGVKDPCGDLDRDGIRNRDDDDADGDGATRGSDPDDLDATRNGRETVPSNPQPPTTGSNTHTHTHSDTTTATSSHTTTASQVQSAAIQDGPAGDPNGRFASAAATLTSHHEATSSRTLRVPHGRRVVIQGRLLAPDGQAIQGAKLDVSTQDRSAGAAFRDFGAVLSGEDGRYKFILPAGPSRTVRIGYRARFGDTSYAQTTDLSVLVTAGLQFRLSSSRLRNGKTVRYAGRLTGPRTGHRFVEVMVKVGRKWIVVCSVRTDAKGSFGCRHRFTKTHTRTTYVFRARVRRQASLPYEPATSVTRRLVVRP